MLWFESNSWTGIRGGVISLLVPGVTNERQALRRRLRRRRREQGAHTRRQAATRLVQQFLCQIPFRRAQNIALYCPVGGEIDVWPLLRASLGLGKRVFLPRVHGRDLTFARYVPGAPLRRGAFGILEPATTVPAERLATLDWVIVPLVGFDANGNRLGQGGGYYDRRFAMYMTRQWRHPKLVGAAYDVQKCATLPVEDWDVRLDRVVTETRCYRA